jgi:hypothetical protein
MLVAAMGLVATFIASGEPVPVPNYGYFHADYIGMWESYPPGPVPAFRVFEYRYDLPADQLGVPKLDSGPKLRAGLGSTEGGAMDAPFSDYLDTFCIDFDGAPPTTGSPPNPYKLYVTDLEEAPMPTGDSEMGGVRANALAKLWGYVATTYGGVQPDFDWSSESPSVADGLNPIQAAAMQAAIWEIVLEDLGSIGDVENGAFGSDDWSFIEEVVTEANGFLANAASWTGTSAYLGALVAYDPDNDTQELVGLFAGPVPEPTTAGLMLLGLLGLVARRRR